MGRRRMSQVLSHHSVTEVHRHAHPPIARRPRTDCMLECVHDVMFVHVQNQLWVPGSPSAFVGTPLTPSGFADSQVCGGGGGRQPRPSCPVAVPTCVPVYGHVLQSKHSFTHAR